MLMIIPRYHHINSPYDAILCNHRYVINLYTPDEKVVVIAFTRNLSTYDEVNKLSRLSIEDSGYVFRRFDSDAVDRLYHIVKAD